MSPRRMPGEPSFPDVATMLDERGFRRMLRRSTVAVVFAAGVPLVLLLGLVLFLLNSALWVDHTDRVISQANLVEKHLVTMQTTFRGYRLSGDEKFLTALTERQREFAEQWEALAVLAADNAKQTAMLSEAKLEAKTWTAFVEAEVAKVKSGASRANDPSFMQVGGPIFDKVLKYLDDFIAREERQRKARVDRLNIVTTALLATLGLVALVGIPTLAWRMQRLLHKLDDSYRANVMSARRRAGELFVTLNSIGDAVIATNEKGEVTFLNPVAEKLTGWRNEEAQGRPLEEIFKISNEQTGAAADNPVERVLRENVIVGLANHTVLESRDGERTPIEDSAAPIRDSEEKVIGVILVFHDVGERRAAEKKLQSSERRFRFLNELGEATRALVDPEQIMEVSTRMLGRHMRTSRCAYADVEPDAEHFTIWHDYTDGCASTEGKYQLSLFGPRAAGDMRTGRTLVINDVDAELGGEGDGAETFNAIGVKAVICCPLIKEMTLRAMMAVHQTSARQWTDEEIELVKEVVERCWATIERARAETEARERGKLSELRGGIATELDLTKPLEQSLQRCSELLVAHLRAAFCRIWIVNPDEPVLDLRASAGIFTALTGPHARIPVGKMAIGRIAKDRKPYLTNDVPHDPYISERGGERDGMVGFAGYPLLVEGRVLGALGVFSRSPFSEAVLADLAPIADSLARHIDRKRTDSALRIAMQQAEAAAQAVKDSAERFRLLAEVVSLQVWTATLDGTLDFANQECAEYFGVAHGQDILGKGWTQFVHEDDLPAALRAWRTSLATGARYEVEFRLRRWDGEYRWFLGRAEAMRDGDGEIVKWFGTNTDIDDLKQAQNAAEGASRAKDSFLAALSHELRTPLTPVLMMATTLREDERLPEDARDQLSMMERNIALEARLIDDLLDLTAIVRGKMQIRAQPCDAHSLIGLAIEIVRDDAQAKEITLEREFTAERSGLVADPARFQQLIWNLLRNAVKFTPRGGRITIHTENEANAWLKIEIKDSGIGIVPEALDKIFLPFEQVSPAGEHRFGGLGLGLAIARAIVDLHGGKIEAQSEGANKGSVFTVELPGSTDAPADVENSTAKADPKAAGAKAGKGANRLLLVEDHEDSIKVLGRLLKLSGFEVVMARSVAEGLAVAEANPFDLVISDLGLPDGTGNELMLQLKKNYGLQGIALSGFGMEEDVDRSLRSGFVNHLTKPVDFNQLINAITKLLG